MKNVLTIAGSDCSGGAGIQADLKTFAAQGVYGMSVITSITAQNTQEIKMIEDVSINILKKQIEAIFEDIEVDAVKIGMLNSKENIKLVYEELLKYRAGNIVLDPVMISTSGKQLLKEDAIEFLINDLFKVVDLISPNLDEAKEIVENILRIDKCYQEKYKELLVLKKDSIEKMKIYGKIITEFTKKWVLIKGGHLSDKALDILIKGDELYVLNDEKIDNRNTHGTGCTLSSAIAANLAKGYSMPEAVKKSKKFILASIKNSISFGKNNGPVNQMGEIYKNIDIEKLY